MYNNKEDQRKKKIRLESRKEALDRLKNYKLLSNQELKVKKELSKRGKNEFHFGLYRTSSHSPINEIKLSDNYSKNRNPLETRQDTFSLLKNNLKFVNYKIKMAELKLKNISRPIQTTKISFNESGDPIIGSVNKNDEEIDNEEMYQDILKKFILKKNEIIKKINDYLNKKKKSSNDKRKLNFLI